MFVLLFLWVFVQNLHTQGTSSYVIGELGTCFLFQLGLWLLFFKSCIFLHICCLYVWVSGSWEELYPHVTAGERETVFKVAFFLLNVKRKLYLSAEWEVESRLQKGLCHCCCREHFVKSLQMQGEVLVIVETPQVPHTHRHGDNVLLFPGHPLNACYFYVFLDFLGLERKKGWREGFLTFGFIYCLALISLVIK